MSFIHSLSNKSTYYKTIMQNFKSKIKSIFKSKSVPQYKAYKQSDLRTLAIKTRIVFDQHRNKLLQKIKQEDSRLRTTYASINPQILFQIETKQKIEKYVIMYKILQEISENIIESQSIVILKQLIKKIEDARFLIIKTDGDMAKLKIQINWFRAVLWYRKSRQIKYIDQLQQFCFNFFKGVDITSEMQVNCQLFKLYPMLGLLNTPKDRLPLKDLYQQLKHTLGWQMDEKILDYIIKKGVQQQNLSINKNSKIIDGSMNSNNPYYSMNNKNTNNDNIIQEQKNRGNTKSQIRQQNNQKILGWDTLNSNIVQSNNQLKIRPSLIKSASQETPYQKSNNSNQKSGRNLNPIANYYTPHPESSYSYKNQKNNIGLQPLKKQEVNRYQQQVNESVLSTIGLINISERENTQKKHKENQNQYLHVTKKEQKNQPFQSPNNRDSPKKPVSMSSLFLRNKKSQQIQTTEINLKNQEVSKVEQSNFELIDMKQGQQRENEQDLYQSLQRVARQHTDSLDLDLLNSNVPFLQKYNQQNLKNNQEQEQSVNKNHLQQTIVTKQANRCLQDAINFRKCQEQAQTVFQQIIQPRVPFLIPDNGSRIMRSSFNNFNQDFNQVSSQFYDIQKEQLLDIQPQQQIRLREQQQHQIINDQRDSINIIRNHINPETDKKFVKKPYMVSVYARKQFIDNARKCS